MLGHGAATVLDQLTAGHPKYLPENRPQPEAPAYPGPDGVPTMVILLAASAVLVTAPCVVLWGLFTSQTPKLLGIYGARVASEAEQHILENLSIGAGLPKPRLFVIETAAPNAFAIGDSDRAIIGVTRGLLELLDHLELEGVLAHELSHIGNRDTQLNATVAALTLFLRLPRLLRQRRISIHEQTTLDVGLLEPPNPWGKLLFVLLLPIFCYFFLVAPLVGALLRSAISREREFLADADAALLTRYPEGLIRALAKIQGAGSLVGTSPVVAHFYFADAVAPESAVFRTHPPVGERIARLSEIHGEVPPATIESATQAGATFAREHLPSASAAPDQPLVQDELSVLNMGNVMGKVYRVLSPACLYERPDQHSPVLARITTGNLLVVFDDPGRFRQALTTGQIFGYLPLSVQLGATNMLPAEILDPAAPGGKAAK
jgi:heat shock protein HtpX